MEGHAQAKVDYCGSVAAVVSGFVWLAAAVFGVLVDANGQCFNNLRFAIFRNKSHVVYEHWITDVTPYKWSFAIWEFLYTWNMLWVVYCVATICRAESCEEGENRCGNIFPIRLHVVWWICSVTHVGWLLLWDREAIVAALFLQGFVIASCATCLIISHKQTYRCGALLQCKHPWDLWVARTLLQNGVSALATWNAFLFSINVIVLLTYQGHLPMHLTSTAVLGTFGAIVFIWFILELTVFDKWLRYTFLVYPVVAWIACGVLARHFYLWSPVTIAAMSLLGIAVVALIIRVPVVVWRNYSYPLYIEQTIPKRVEAGVTKRDCVTTIL